jgi:hypothetical protein
MPPTANRTYYTWQVKYVPIATCYGPVIGQPAPSSHVRRLPAGIDGNSSPCAYRPTTTSTAQVTAMLARASKTTRSARRRGRRGRGSGWRAAAGSGMGSASGRSAEEPSTRWKAVRPCGRSKSNWYSWPRRSPVPVQNNVVSGTASRFRSDASSAAWKRNGSASQAVHRYSQLDFDARFRGRDLEGIRDAAGTAGQVFISRLRSPYVCTRRPDAQEGTWRSPELS